MSLIEQLKYERVIPKMREMCRDRAGAGGGGGRGQGEGRERERERASFSQENTLIRSTCAAMSHKRC